MANITIRVGAQSAVVSSTDAKAAQVLALYIEARYENAPLMRFVDVDLPVEVPLAELSAAQRLDWIAADLARYMAEVARGHHRATVRQAADEAARGESEALAWQS